MVLQSRIGKALTEYFLVVVIKAKPGISGGKLRVGVEKAVLLPERLNPVIGKLHQNFPNASVRFCGKQRQLGRTKGNTHEVLKGIPGQGTHGGGIGKQLAAVQVFGQLLYDLR